MSALTREKLAQARALVKGSDLDAWLIFVRETSEGGDPVLPLLLNRSVTWQSAFLITKSRAIAIVGNYDADPVRSTGDWDEVVPYVQSIREPLRQALEAVGVKRIGLNYSTDDDKADGLTHGMFLLLQDYLEGFELTSAADLAMSLRGRKTQEELKRIRKAIRETEKLFLDIQQHLEDDIGPQSKTERMVFNRVQRLMKERGLGFAWDQAGDPIVNSGPDSMIGHGIASDQITLEEGHVFHVDLGVTKDGYSSDIQRCWYVGAEVTPDVEQALDAVNAAITAAADTLKPGVEGWQVDDAARTKIQELGYEEYMHAVGHQVGRVAHDGGTLLGPKWQRYGRSPMQKVQEDEVYTLELGVIVPGRGYLGIEEMARVTASGCEFLTKRQLTMPVVSH